LGFGRNFARFHADEIESSQLVGLVNPGISRVSRASSGVGVRRKTTALATQLFWAVEYLNPTSSQRTSEAKENPTQLLRWAGAIAAIDRANFTERKEPRRATFNMAESNSFTTLFSVLLTRSRMNA
jgi:hypothetical protein